MWVSRRERTLVAVVSFLYTFQQCLNLFHFILQWAWATEQWGWGKLRKKKTEDWIVKIPYKSKNSILTKMNTIIPGLHFRAKKKCLIGSIPTARGFFLTGTQHITKNFAVTASTLWHHQGDDSPTASCILLCARALHLAPLPHASCTRYQALLPTALLLSVLCLTMTMTHLAKHPWLPWHGTLKEHQHPKMGIVWETRSSVALFNKSAIPRFFPNLWNTGNLKTVFTDSWKSILKK